MRNKVRLTKGAYVSQALHWQQSVGAAARLAGREAFGLALVSLHREL